MKGAAGTLLAGGRIAARLRNWTMEHQDAGSVIRAAVEPAEGAFWLEHSPRFDVVLQVGSQSWRWRRVEVLIDQAEGAEQQMKAVVEEKPEVRT